MMYETSDKTAIENCFGDIVNLWRQWRPTIDRAVMEVLASIPESSAIEVAKYIVEGGKRFRGFLALLVAESLGAEPFSALDAAVAVELVHAASLAQDDIIDVDYKRRGRDAAWVVYGIGKTVMVSNLLIPFSQKLVLSKYGVEALARTVKAWLDISRGEIMDAFMDPRSFPPTEYIRLARLKTGALFRLACELGVISSGSMKFIDSFGNYGEDLGLVYQFADDIVDLALYEKGLIGELSPSTELFRSLVGSLSNALRKLRDAVGNVSEKARSLPMVKRKNILERLPVFMVEAMLKEANLSLGLIYDCV